jgi:hypothetical protein
MMEDNSGLVGGTGIVFFILLRPDVNDSIKEKDQL